MKAALLIAALMFAFTVSAVEAAPKRATCSVSPSVVALNTPVTITVDSNTRFDMDIYQPLSVHTTIQYPPGTYAIEFLPPIAQSGAATVVVNVIQNHTKRPMASCEFTVQ